MDSCPNCGGAMEAAVAPDDIPTDFGTVHAPAVPIERCKGCGAEFVGEAGYEVRAAAVAAARALL
jgi:transposase